MTLLIFIFIIFLILRSKAKGKQKYINIDNKVEKAYRHENCETEGFVVHPEKTGILKRNDNPFEL